MPLKAPAEAFSTCPGFKCAPTAFHFPPVAHDLSALWPAVQPHITQLKNVTAVEGSAAMISCVAEGEPLPDISWRRASDGQSFMDGVKVQTASMSICFRVGVCRVLFVKKQKVSLSKAFFFFLG